MRTRRWLFLSILLLAEPCNAQNVRSSWEKVPASPIALFVAFDSSNILFVGESQSGAYYSSNRGITWVKITESAIGRSSRLDIVEGVAIAHVPRDSADYSSSDMGHTWIRHPFDSLPSVLEGSRPIPQRWYGVGKGWYQTYRVYSSLPFPQGYYYYLRQDKAFGPLVVVSSPHYETINERLFDAADSATYAYTGFQASYWKGDEQTRLSLKCCASDLKYIRYGTWLAYDNEGAALRIRVFPLFPADSVYVTDVPYPVYRIYSQDSIIIASYQKFTANYNAGAYISRDLGKTWEEMAILDNNFPPENPPSFVILDSLHMFMRYNYALYYTSSGGGPTIPLASVAAGRDAAPGVAVFGSVLTVSGGGEVEVLDLLGRRVVRTERSASGEPVKINLLPYPDGIYFVHSGKEITKILWQRE